MRDVEEIAGLLCNNGLNKEDWEELIDKLNLSDEALETIRIFLEDD